CKWCQICTFKHQGKWPVMIQNGVDGDVLPLDFNFIENCVLGEGVEYPHEDFCPGCSCNPSTKCKTKKCDCLDETDFLGQHGYHGEAYAYYEKSATSYLKEEYLESREPIYECHDGCKCGPDCPNKVVANGRTIPLAIFKTEDGRGWGVKSTYKIKKGQFVDKYVGEIITAEETERRREASEHAQKKNIYLFELDKFKGNADQDASLAETLFVDGEFKSGPTRFINHSCDPNLRIFARVGAPAMKRFHDLAFFAIKDIEAGVELTFDYIDGDDEEELKLLNKDKRNKKTKAMMTKCLCKAKNCRGYLW
ncbi:structural basis For the product specificity of histone lysine methyltransferase, partial [Tricladium varicosporioides]